MGVAERFKDSTCYFVLKETRCHCDRNEEL